MSCLPIPSLALHKVHVLACIAQHHLGGLVGMGSMVISLQYRCAMCHTMLCKI